MFSRLLGAVLLSAALLNVTTPALAVADPDIASERADPPEGELPVAVIEDQDAPDEEPPGACHGDEQIDGECPGTTGGRDDALETEHDRAAVLAEGEIDTGSVTLDGAGTVTRQVRLPAASRARVRAAKVRTGASKGKLLCSVTKRIGRAGGVADMLCKLSRAGVRTLRSHAGATLSVRTVIRRKGRRPVVSTDTITVR